MAIVDLDTDIVRPSDEGALPLDGVYGTFAFVQHLILRRESKKSYSLF